MRYAMRCAICDGCTHERGKLQPAHGRATSFFVFFPMGLDLALWSFRRMLGRMRARSTTQLSVPFAFRSPRLVTRFTTRTTTGGWTPRGPRTYLFGVRGSAGVCSSRFSGDVATALCPESLRCCLSVGSSPCRGQLLSRYFSSWRACVPSGSVPRFTSFFARRVLAVLPVVVYAADGRSPVRATGPSPTSVANQGSRERKRSPEVGGSTVAWPCSLVPRAADVCSCAAARLRSCVLIFGR